MVNYSNKQEYVMPHERLLTIDLLKIGAVLIIFAFHCNMHLGVEFSFLTPFISQGAVVMDLFFIVSGFTLFYKYQSDTLLDQKEIMTFYYKRLAAIYPLYLLILVIFFVIGTESIQQKIITLPIELSLLQSWFSGLFSFSHNGGTWFLSCLAVCYALYPLARTWIYQLNQRKRMALLIIIYLICASTPFITSELALPNMYSSPLLRFLQFLSGGILFEMVKGKSGEIGGRDICIVSGICFGLVYFVSVFARNDYRVNEYISYGFITYPLFCFMVVYALKTESIFYRKYAFKKHVKKISSYAYAVFMAQFFVWNPTKQIVLRYPTVFKNYTSFKIFLLAGIICFVITLILSEGIEKPCFRFLTARTIAINDRKVKEE